MKSKIDVFLRDRKTNMECFSHDRICPDVIDSDPLAILGITYENDLKIKPGKVVTPTQVQNEPTLIYDADPSSYYTLIMHDPDAPSRENNINGEWQHWLIGNIPGNRVKDGDVLSEYIGAGPPKDTGLHRYVFVVFKQDRKINFELPRLTCHTMKGRAKQKVRDICKKYHLTELVASNYFMAEWDEYVVQLYAKFR
ncbi:hypothetical protein LOTGIDRAFT_119949 [Lottia gigantea]|uniref:Phosphatidylethanolamine-binding protein n=1 Tax=Lottia gigantea TaxID=225164 RepID=V4AI87_LOTGI|nr:hypothetical protein LOTGIDRAFT_119949 [Lottia gigantea]ESO93146.1 hypothetical protein LOTGIDRAFT_119949 [Lottia gigantea]